MEQTIALPKVPVNEVFASQVKDILDIKGIIIILNKDNENVGHVILEDDRWFLRTIELGEERDSLELLLIDYPEYTFKLIT